MFICDVCSGVQEPYVKPTRVVVETRDVRYPSRQWANDPGGFGHEIVKEVNVCPDCVKGATQ